jgi:hypothetical protein
MREYVIYRTTGGWNIDLQTPGTLPVVISRGHKSRKAAVTTASLLAGRYANVSVR